MYIKYLQWHLDLVFLFYTYAKQPVGNEIEFFHFLFIFSKIYKNFSSIHSNHFLVLLISDEQKEKFHFVTNNSFVSFLLYFFFGSSKFNACNLLVIKLNEGTVNFHFQLSSYAYFMLRAIKKKIFTTKIFLVYHKTKRSEREREKNLISVKKKKKNPRRDKIIFFFCCSYSW